MQSIVMKFLSVPARIFSNTSRRAAVAPEPRTTLLNSSCIIMNIFNLKGHTGSTRGLNKRQNVFHKTSFAYHNIIALFSLVFKPL